jgi:hypothetical protein
VPGWKRYPPMQLRLEAALAAQAAAPPASGARIDDAAVAIDMARQVARKMSNDPKEQERIIKDFMEWTKTRR